MHCFIFWTCFQGHQIHITIFIGSSTSQNFYTKKSRLDIQKNAFSLIGAKIWNEMPNSLKNISRKTFSKKPKGALLTVLDGRVQIKWYCNTVKDLLSPNIVSQKDEKPHTTGLDDTTILHIKIKITEVLLEKKLNTVNPHVPLLKIKINFYLVYTMLWFSFILGWNFIVLCLKLIFNKIEPQHNLYTSYHLSSVALRMKIDMSCVEGDIQICRYTVTFINLKVIYEINADRQIYSDGISLQFAYSPIVVKVFLSYC